MDCICNHAALGGFCDFERKACNCVGSGLNRDNVSIRLVSVKAKGWSTCQNGVANIPIWGTPHPFETPCTYYSESYLDLSKTLNFRSIVLQPV